MGALGVGRQGYVHVDHRHRGLNAVFGGDVHRIGHRFNAHPLNDNVAGILAGLHIRHQRGCDHVHGGLRLFVLDKYAFLADCLGNS